MAGGPIYPVSAVPVTSGKVFPYIANVASEVDHLEGLGVMASVDGDAIWRLRFLMPPSIPSGTCKLWLLANADATSGDAKVNPKWDSVDAEADMTLAASLNAEGTSTITWASGDDKQLKEATITLDATTAPAASEIVLLDLTFETSSWTLAAISTWLAAIIWE